METSFEMVIKIVAGLFIAGIAFLILEVVYDAIARGKARRERIRKAQLMTRFGFAPACEHDHGRLPLHDAHGTEIGSVGYIVTKHNGSKEIPKGHQLIEVTPTEEGSLEIQLKRITRRGKTYMITVAQHEEMKRVNREKMQAYRAKKKAAKVTNTPKKKAKK